MTHIVQCRLAASWPIAAAFWGLTACRAEPSHADGAATSASSALATPHASAQPATAAPAPTSAGSAAACEGPGLAFGSEARLAWIAVGKLTRVGNVFEIKLDRELRFSRTNFATVRIRSIALVAADGAEAQAKSLEPELTEKVGERISARGIVEVAWRPAATTDEVEGGPGDVRLHLAAGDVRVVSARAEPR